ncbi:MAG: hypothetical protein ACRENI_01575 [Gemmatimonadaceae bacterium]
MKIAIQMEPPDDAPPAVEYRWDEDTDILSATLRRERPGEAGRNEMPAHGGLSGTVELQGSDGSWLNLDVAAGRIHAVEVAVWPPVRRLASLAPPPSVDSVAVAVPARGSRATVDAVEVDTALIADANTSESIFHFRLGRAAGARTVRLASDILIDVSPGGQLTGLWLLNVPPFPANNAQ